MLVARAGPLLRSDVLLAPHHGSKTSCSRPFLQQVRPQLCVVSSGSGNTFGFPHLKTLKRLRECGISVLRTDRVGAIEALVRRDGMQIKTYVHASDEKGVCRAASRPSRPVSEGGGDRGSRLPRLPQEIEAAGELGRECL